MSQKNSSCTLNPLKKWRDVLKADISSSNILRYLFQGNNHLKEKLVSSLMLYECAWQLTCGLGWPVILVLKLSNVSRFMRLLAPVRNASGKISTSPSVNYNYIIHGGTTMPREFTYSCTVEQIWHSWFHQWF